MSVVEYFNIILKPEPTMQGDLKTVDRREAMKSYALVGAVFGLIVGLGVASLGSLLAGIGGGLGALAVGLGIAAIIVFPIVLAILSVIGGFIGTGIMYLIAKALGGTGTFDQQFYLSARLVWPMFFAMIGIFILSMIPFLGVVISFVWNLYSLYLQVVLISVTHKVSKMKGLLIILVPIILVVIIGAIFAAALFASILGAGAALAN